MLLPHHLGYYLFSSVGITTLDVGNGYIARPIASPPQAISSETSCQFTLWCFCYYTSHSIRHLCIHSHCSKYLITRPSHSRCSRIRVSEKRPRLRNRQRLPGCLRGHLIPGKLRAESGRTELFAVGSGNTAAINDAGAFRYRGRHSRGEILSRGSVHLLSLSGCSDFSCPNCPNGLVRDDDAAVLKILS